MDAEFGGPLWALGLRRYSFEDDGTLVCMYEQDGLGHLAHLRVRGEGLLELFDTPYTVFAQVVASGRRAVFLAGSATESLAVVECELSTGHTSVLRRAADEELPPELVSIAEPISFAARDGSGPSHALFYSPRNPSFRGMDGELPPLVVMSHGGPTSASSVALKLEIQYWTSRGFAVVDVNYGGSSGYGRAYRDRLKGQWGIVDVDDCVGAALSLADARRVDRERLVIRGGSAGGYTALAALVFRDVFRAGASYYGVSDLEALAKHTHKFESRYLDSLVAPYPEGRAIYEARSPIHFTDRLSCPVIFFQGLEDRVVPPAQAERMVEALRAKNLPVAYVAFEGEQHGFRNAANIKRSLEYELFFYLKVFGLTPVEPLESIAVDNLP
jgi:dipeptidyl aminopeptidase/acylaminoacyl peptidase